MIDAQTNAHTQCVSEHLYILFKFINILRPQRQYDSYHDQRRKNAHTISNPTSKHPKKIMHFLTFVHLRLVKHFCCFSHSHVMQCAKNKANQLFYEVNAIDLETRTDMFVCAFVHVPRQFSFHFIHIFKNIHRYLKVRLWFFGCCMSVIHTIETKDQGYFRFLWHFKLCAVLCCAVLVCCRHFGQVISIFRLTPSLMCENTRRNSVAWFGDFLFLTAKISHSLERTAV